MEVEKKEVLCSGVHLPFPPVLPVLSHYRPYGETDSYPVSAQRYTLCCTGRNRRMYIHT